MKKETIAAIIFGIVLGGIVAVFILIKNKEIQLAKNKTIKPQENTAQAPTSVTVNFAPLEITEPHDRGIVSQNSITIKGSFTKNSLVVIQSPIKDLVFKSDQERFSKDFPLALGENVIRITAYPSNKQLRTQEKEIRVYYFPNQL